MTQNATLPWSLEEVDYTYAASHVHANGRIEGTLHPPDYYAYFTPTSSWSDGLQEIEDFDWSAGEKPVQDTVGDIAAADSADNPQATNSFQSNGKEPEQEALTQEDDFQGLDAMTGVVSADSPDGTGSADSLDLVNADAMDAEETDSRPYANLDDDASRPTLITKPASNASAPKVTGTDASHMPSALSPWISDLFLELPAASDTTDQHAELLEHMDINEIPATPETEAEQGPSVKDNDDASANPPDSYQEEPDVEAVQGSKSISNDVASNAAPEMASVLTEPVTLVEVQVHQSSESEPVEKPSMTPEALSNTIISEHVVTADSKPEALPSLLAEDIPEEPDATTKPPSVLTRASPEPGTYHESSMLPEAHCDTKSSEDASPARGKPESPLPLPAEDQQLGLQGILHNQPKTEEQPAASQLLPAVPPTLAALAPADNDLEDSWQAELQQTAHDPFLGCLSELLPPGNSEGLGATAETTATTGMDETLVQASPYPASVEEALPYPFEPDADAIDGRKDLTSQSQSEIHSPIIDDGDEMTVDGLESTSVAINVSEASVEEEKRDQSVAIPAIHGNDSIIVDQSETSASKSKVKTTNPRKRSKPTMKAKDAPETDDDAPAKKILRMAALAKPCASRAKKTKVSDEQQAGNEAPPPKRKCAATKSKKETAAMSETRDEPLSKLGYGVSKFEDFAYGKYAHPDGQMTFGTEAKLQQPDYTDDDIDMEEHYSDLETPSSSKRDRPPVSNRDLGSLTVTKYRDRSSQARSHMSTEEGFAKSGPRIKRPNIFGTLLSSTNTSKLEDSPAVLPKNDNSFLLIEPQASTTGSTPKVAAPPALPNPKARAPKSAKEAVKNTPATRAPRNKKAALFQEEIEEVQEQMQEEEEDATPVQEDEEEPDLFPAPKIEVKKAVEKKELPSPPIFRASAGRSTRSKKFAAQPEEGAIPSDEQEPVLNDDHPEDEQNESDSAQDTFDPPASDKEDAGDLSDEAAFANVKKGKAGAEFILQGLHDESASPAPPAASSCTSGTNNFGFTSPRDLKTRQSNKKISMPALRSKLASKFTSPPKGKGSTKKSIVEVEDGENSHNENEEKPAPGRKATARVKGRARKSDVEPQTEDAEGPAPKSAAKAKTKTKKSDKAEARDKAADEDDNSEEEGEEPSPKTTTRKPAPKSTHKPAAKPRSRPKSRKSDVDAASEAPTSTGASSARQTRRAPARKEEIRQAQDKAGASGKFRTKLRNKGRDEGFSGSGGW